MVLDGVDDWVDMGQIDTSSNKITLDIVFFTSEIVEDDKANLLSNHNYGGVALYLNSGVPTFSIWFSEIGRYINIKSDTALSQGERYRVTGTYDGSKMCLYVNGKLVASRDQTGSIQPPTNNTTMAIGVNPNGDEPDIDYYHMRVYGARIYDRALSESEIEDEMLESYNTKAWDVSAQQDGSIRAWLGTGLENSVTIGSKSTMYANQDSSYLFANISAEPEYNVTYDGEIFKNLELLNVDNVTNMYAMFYRCGYKNMTKLNLGNNFKTSNVTNMASMFWSTGHSKMQTLNLGSNFDTSQVTNMANMFMETGYSAMTSLSLGSKFNTQAVTNMSAMFRDCGNKALTSLSLGDQFFTNLVNDMNMMFTNCGTTALTSLDLGPAFTQIGDKYDTVATNGFMNNTGKSGAVIYVPEAIYKNRTSFKKGTSDKSTAEGAIAVSSGRTVNVKYKPEWKVVSTSIDETNKTLSINIEGAANSNYSSVVTSNLSANSISLWIDRTELVGVEKTVSEPSGSAPVTQTITIKNFEEALRHMGKDFTEWSGNITLKIESRNDKTGSYTRKVLVDSYGNQNMSKTDESGTWVDISFKDSTTSSKNTAGKLFVDFIKPEFTYNFSETTIDHEEKKVTIDFSVADKYFSSSKLTSDEDANNIKVKFEGVEATEAKKKLTKIEDITYTVDDKETKIGEKYRLEVTKLDKGKGIDYSGIMQLSFDEGLITDQSGNKNVATTITVGVEIPQSVGLGHIGMPEGDTVMVMGANPNKNGVNKNFAKIKIYSAKISDEKGVISSYDASKNTGSGHSSTTTTWKDLTGDNDGVVNGATWGNDYLEFDGVDDWVNLGQIYPTNQVTIEATISTNEIQTDSADILCNFQIGGAGIYLFDGQPTFTIYSQENSQYVILRASEKVKVGEKTNIKGVYDGKDMYLYVNGTLAAKTEMERHNTKEIVDVVSPVWKAENFTVDKTNKVATVELIATDKYLTGKSNSTLTEDKITVSVDGDTGANSTIKKKLSDATYIERNDSGFPEIKYTLTLSNWAQTSRQSGKKYLEYSGKTSIKIAEGTLIDDYSNINEEYTVTFEKEDEHVDFINPEFTYEYSETEIDHDEKTVTVIFDVADKYFKQANITANNISIKIDKEEPDWTKAKKALSKKELEKDQVVGNITYKANGDIYYPINGVSTKVGERYQLVLTELDQTDGDNYSGTMTMSFGANLITDKSGNGNIAKTITIGIDDPTTDHPDHNSEQIVDVVSPVWKTENIKINKSSKNVTVDLIATDKYLTEKSSALTKDNVNEKITVSVDGDTGANSTIRKTLSEPTYIKASNSSTGLPQIKYTLTLSNWEQDKKTKTYLEWSGTTKITIAAGTVTDQYSNKSEEKTFTLGHVDFIKPRIEKVKSEVSKGDDNTETITFNVIDKYLDTSDEVKADEITVYVDGENATGVTKTITKVESGNVYATINGSLRLVSQQYKLVLSDFEQTRGSGKLYKNWSGTVSIDIAEGAVKDITSGNSVNTNEKTTITGDFVDFIKPEFTYEYSETKIDHGAKTVTIIFSIADKYFSSSTLTIDKITVTVGGQTIPPEKKSLNATDDIKSTVNNVSKKVGERYTLVLEELDLGGGGDYSGITTLKFDAGIVTDTSENKNIAKKITVGIDDPTTDDPDHNSEQIVDVVSPVWKTQNLEVDKTNQFATIELIATDRYLTSVSNSTLTKYNLKDKITVSVDGDSNANSVIEKELVGEPEFIDNSQGELKQIKYKLKLSKWEEDSKQSGKTFLEWSGTTSITIAAGTVTDDYTNTSKEQTLDVGHVDVIKPRIEKVKTSRGATSETIIFNVIDKYLDTSDEVTADEITVYVDEEIATGVTKTITTSGEVYATINGSSQLVSKQYSLVLSNFEQSRSSIDSEKNFADWSGTVRINIAEGAVKDKISGKSVNTNDSVSINADFVDYIPPKVTYQYVTGDIDYNAKTFTMKFEITDKYFENSAFATEYENATTDEAKFEVFKKYITTINIDGKNIIEDDEVIKKITAIEDVRATKAINKTVDGTVKKGLTNELIGKSFTLEISELAKSSVSEGGQYLDYSGVITVGVAANAATDKGTTGNGTRGNSSTTITSGVNIPGGTGTGTVVDVVDPIWELAGNVIVKLEKQTATLPVKGTDKYIQTINLTVNDIAIEVDGQIKTAADGVTVTVREDTSVTLAYGKKYIIDVSGYSKDASQVKVILKEGLIVDKSGNKSEEKVFVLFSALKETLTETEATSPFLGNTKIQRQKIEKIIFKNDLDGINNTKWDVSQIQDQSILAWYTTDATTGNYTVYIGSYVIICSNKISDYLFSYIGYNSTCKVTGNTGATDGTQKPLIENLDLLHTNATTSMQGMFRYFGYSTMKSFDLGSTFDTSNVLNMHGMFSGTGHESMTTLNLGSNFNTSNVIDMSYMFNFCGYNKLTSLNLGSQFDTSNVTNMKCMLFNLGHSAMTSLNLGDEFDTSSVTNMESMFRGTGHAAMTSLDLGDKFDTSNVTNMRYMFRYTGYGAMTRLDLGELFNTTNVTDMYNMFYNCGYTAMTSLDLGDLFYTNNVKDMYKMFYKCGGTSMTTLDLGAVFTKIPYGTITKQESDYEEWEDEKLTSYKAYDGFAEGCGAEGLKIYAPESIYAGNGKFYVREDAE